MQGVNQELQLTSLLALNTAWFKCPSHSCWRVTNHPRCDQNHYWTYYSNWCPQKYNYYTWQLATAWKLGSWDMSYQGEQSLAHTPIRAHSDDTIIYYRFAVLSWSWAYSLPGWHVGLGNQCKHHGHGNKPSKLHAQWPGGQCHSDCRWNALFQCAKLPPCVLKQGAECNNFCSENHWDTEVWSHIQSVYF